MINLTKQPSFQFRLTRPDAIPIVIPMAQWILAANDEAMYTKEKR